jgi:hypothetical protein
MAAPVLDPGLAALAAERPCSTRRWILKADPTQAANYNWFPWKGQYRDTPVGTPTRWTTDDDVLTPGV